MLCFIMFFQLLEATKKGTGGNHKRLKISDNIENKNDKEIFSEEDFKNFEHFLNTKDL